MSPSPTSADSVAGCAGGIQKTDLSTTEVVFNITAWCNSYVKMQAFGSRVFYVFSTTATNNVISDVEALTAATPNAGAPDWIEAGTSEHEIVPELPAGQSAMYLHVKGSAASTRFKARKAQR